MFAYLRDGTPILLRPIDQGDAGLLRDAWNRTSPESQRRRMHGPAALSSRTLADLVDVDHDDHEAVVAIDPDEYAIVGVARYIRDPRRSDEAELAVLVVDGWQRRGVASELVASLTARALEAGIRRYVALVGPDNVPALHALRRLGARPMTRSGDTWLTVPLANAMPAKLAA